MNQNCITVRKAYSRQENGASVCLPCEKGDHTLFGPDDCLQCQAIRDRFFEIWNSPAHDLKYYFDPNHIFSEGKANAHKFCGWMNIDDPDTYTKYHTKESFKVEVDSGRYLYTVGDILTFHGFNPGTWTESYEPFIIHKIYYSAPTRTNHRSRRPIMGGCGERCSELIQMLTDADRINKKMVRDLTSSLRREIKFLHHSAIKEFHRGNASKYMKGNPHSRPIFQCQCNFHTQFALQKRVFELPNFCHMYYIPV